MGIAVGTNFIYTITPGDTIYSVAARLGSSVEAIVHVNHISHPDLVYPGNVLVVPSAFTTEFDTPFVVTAGDSLYQITVRFTISVDLIAGINQGTQNPNLIRPGQRILIPGFIYRVEPNDTLYKIAQELGIPIDNIIRANLNRPSFSPDVIYPGYSLIIPLPTSENIAAFAPLPGTVIQSGSPVAGWARAFEGTVLHQVRDSNGVIVSEERAVTASKGAPAFGWFSDTLPFDRQPTSPDGEVWVYTESVATGEIQDLVRVKVNFLSAL